MKKLKKLFQLLPVFAIAFISGLSSFIFKDYEYSSSYADSMSLVSARSFSDVNVHYRSITYDRVSHNFSYNLRLYYDNLRGSYSLFFDLTFNLNTTNNYGILIDGGNFYPANSPSAFTCNLVFDNLVDFGFNGLTTRNLYLNCVGIKSNSDLYSAGGDGVWFPRDSVVFTSQYRFELYIEGFERSISLLEGPFSSNDITEGFSVPSSDFSLFSYRSIDMNDYFNLATYSVDLAQNNYTIGYADGYSVGYSDGQAQGYADGYSTGNANGYETGYSAGRDSRDQDVTNAYNNGYAEGFAAGNTANGTAITIFNGILQVGMLPINILLAIFNFEILGINLSAFVSSILTVCLTIIVIRTIGGKKE